MSKQSNKGLGKGLETLIPTEFDVAILDNNEKVQKLSVEIVIPNPNQPRRHFEEAALAELAQSIEAHGIIQPLVVTRAGNQYRIVAGERRWRAAQIAGLTEVPAIVRSIEELTELEVALIENVQRVDLSPLEQAISIERLHQQFSMTYGDIAKRLGKATTTVNNIVRLLQLPEEAKTALQQQRITEGHARAILALKGNAAKQQELLDSIEKYGWSVRQAEQFVTASRRKPDTSAIKKHMAKTTPQTEKLSKRLSAPVTIRRTAKGGRLEIHFANDKELENILEELK